MSAPFFQPAHRDGHLLGDEGKTPHPEIADELRGTPHRLGGPEGLGGANSGHTAGGIAECSRRCRRARRGASAVARVVADPRKIWWRSGRWSRRAMPFSPGDDRRAHVGLRHSRRLLDIAWEDYRVNVPPMNAAPPPRHHTAYLDEVGQQRLPIRFSRRPNCARNRAARRPRLPHNQRVPRERSRGLILRPAHRRGERAMPRRSRSARLRRRITISRASAPPRSRSTWMN